VEESGLELPEEVSIAIALEDKSGGDDLDRGGLEDAPAISSVNPTLMGRAGGFETRDPCLKGGCNVRVTRLRVILQTAQQDIDRLFA
jgi:hypothetical protein